MEGYSFDKHWHYSFDVLKCPPWDLSKEKAGIFKPPPHPREVKATDFISRCASITCRGSSIKNIMHQKHHPSNIITSPLSTAPLHALQL